VLDCELGNVGRMSNLVRMDVSRVDGGDMKMM
jgi:hypothetical protein